MQRYVANRLVWLIVVMLGVTFLTFVITHVIPANPALAAVGPDATQEQVETMKKLMGLDKSLPEQYTTYLLHILQGDLGNSSRMRHPVVTDLRAYFPATVELAIASILLYTLMGVPLGVFGAIHRGSVWDRAIDAMAVSGLAMPQFWLALMFQYVFYAQLDWFPITGRLASGLRPPDTITGMYVLDSLLTANWQTFASALHHLALPALTLTLSILGNVTRVTRRAMIGVLGQDYVRTARAKGLSERHVVYRHALRNALIPIITIVGLQIGWVLSGSVFVEIIFSWPGIGSYLFDSIAYLDFQPIMGTTLMIGFIFVFVNFFVDIAYHAIDPRIVHR